MFIIDGVPYDPNGTQESALENLDGSDISYVTVLKGTAAAQLYGSSGVNGVIIVTTKTKRFWDNSGGIKLIQKKFKNYTYKTNSTKL